MTAVNPLVFTLSKLGVGALERLFKASVHVFGAENLPHGVIIFVVNHFTRLETLVLPYEFYKLTGKPVMSLAYHGLFTGALRNYLESMGAVSTKDPNRDRIIVRSLLQGDHPWMIFPEGSMIKDKKIVERGKFLIYSATGSRRPPHTGAVALALRSEFYRQRISHLRKTDPALLRQQLEIFDLTSPEEVSELETFLVPVNVTYYPIRSRQNALEKLATYLMKDIPEQLREELQTEGTMLLSGVDMDICCGKPLMIKPWLSRRLIQKDIRTPRPILPDEVLPSRAMMRRIASNLTMKVMASIYRMTTVNYDHLVAYLLKYYHSNSLTLFDLAVRLYVAAEDVTTLNDVRFHTALHQDQCAQFCRRYRHILADFLAVAKKSGVLEVDGETIHKKHFRVTPHLDFRTVRRDNPYMVVLNEVEYLRNLTRRLRLIAWRPGWLIRRRLSRQFLKMNQEEFTADYGTYAREGESKPMLMGAPFFVRSFRGGTGVLLVHGYMAAPEEVRPLATYLHQHGYTVYAPRLRGHGTSPEDLAERSWEDWIESLERGYLVLANTCKEVVLGGFSMGGGLTLLAAANNLYKVKAVFAINPPAKLRKRTARLAPALVLWNKVVDRLSKDEGRWHFVPNEPENPEINYLRNPVSGVKELMELMDRVSEQLNEIRIPVLLIQSSDDPVVHPEGSEELYEGLGSTDKELVIFPAARHGIIRGEGSQRVFARVLEFLSNRL
jgi:esterase/lipase/1-acyl-sn-glycerol-3-phosphate acyltransferase